MDQSVLHIVRTYERRYRAFEGCFGQMLSLLLAWKTGTQESSTVVAASVL